MLRSSAILYRNLYLRPVCTPLFRSFSSLPDHEFLPLPSLSPTMTTGTISKWLKGEGDFVEAGDVICEVETDKAVVDFEVTDDGYVAKILHPTGAADLPVATPIAVIVDEEEHIAAFSDYTYLGKTPKVSLSSESSSSPQISSTSSPSLAAAAQSKTQSIVKTMDDRHNHFVNNSHRQSSIKFKYGIRVDVSRKSDVIAAILPQEHSEDFSKSLNSVARRTRGHIDIPVTQMRKVIADRLTQSKAEVPHFYSTSMCHIGPLLDIRAKLNKESGRKASVNDFVIRAAALALRDVPACNVSFDVATDSKFQNPGIDIAVAVATDGGLITPIVKDAISKEAADIGTDVRELAGRAREGRLKPVEFMGGSFTISNLGMFGMNEFSAVINPPQACILAVSGGSEMLVPKSSGDPELSTSMNVTLSCDARAVEPADAAQFLQVFQEYINNPTQMIA